MTLREKKATSKLDQIINYHKHFPITAVRQLYETEVIVEKVQNA